MSSRMESAGESAFDLKGENIAAGPSDDPEDWVIQLLIDDGVPSRGHRHNIFEPKFKAGACGVASHTYGLVSVFDYTSNDSGSCKFIPYPYSLCWKLRTT